jgi:DNA-binding MarR family transcriptional regulator
MRTTSEAILNQEDTTRLRTAVLRLARRLRQQAHTGITPSQLSALAMIEREGPLSLGDLANLENVQPPSMSRLVGVLEGDGYVERVADRSDRRIALVQVTAKARRELQAIRQERNEWTANRVAALEPAERDHLLAALPVLERLVEMDDPS